MRTEVPTYEEQFKTILTRAVLQKDLIYFTFHLIPTTIDSIMDCDFLLNISMK